MGRSSFPALAVMSRWFRARHIPRFGLAIGATLGGLLFLASCGGTDVATPVQYDIGDTYMRATFTVLDDIVPCRPAPLSCDPEFYSCEDGAPHYVGDTFTFQADSVSAGVTGDLVSPSPNPQITISGTDLGAKTGVAILFNLDDVLTMSTSIPATFNSTFASVDTTCLTLGPSREPVSEFNLVAASPRSITLSELEVDVADTDTYPGPLVVAESDGRGGFAPAGIIAGTFSFVGQNRQETALGQVAGQIRVTGCFRLPLTFPVQGVPVTATPANPGC